MNAQHRPRRPRPEPDRRLVRDNLRALISANAFVAVVLCTAEPGRSPALGLLASLAPLWLWGLLGYGGTAALLMARQYVWGHRLGVIAWFALAAALVIGVSTGASGSPAASLMFAGLACVLLALHLNGLRFRRARRDQQAPRKGQ